MQRSPRKRATATAPPPGPARKPGDNDPLAAPPPWLYLAHARPFARHAVLLTAAAIAYAVWLAWLTFAAATW